jgi:hypothetical protein
MPPWLIGVLTIIGAVGGGSVAGYGGGSQATRDIAALEQKVDKLNEQIHELTIGFVRAHPNVPVETTP